MGDWAFCEGINRFVFHRYALQPWRDRAPGMSMGPWGLHYERTETWWEQSAAWHEYLARCQYLLRQGLFVADICFLEPEGSPMRFTPTMSWREGNTPERPRYNFDGCTPEVLFTRMKVKNRRLVLPDGMSYQLLVLPQIETMSPKLLRRINELVQAGATVVGPPPVRAPGLCGYPGCDEELRKLAAKIWAPAGASRTASRRVLWADEFKTPQAEPDTESPVAHARWIWHREGNPAASAPPGSRYFHRNVVLDPNRRLDSARFSLTVDNTFELFVNGRSSGTGDNFKRLYVFDVKNLLRPGTNVIAIAAVNTTTSPNPAGFIGTLALKYQDGPAVEIRTDSQWQSATNAAPGWTTAEDPQGVWDPAMELGGLGMQPWGELDTSAGPPYVYPNFDAIAAWLKSQGVAPDFEGDDNLRFIHRRDGDADFYFVANRQTNWLTASCAFRVAGKQPEIWDPLTGQIASAATFEQVDGRTVLPLTFEPAGSLFVVFRQPCHKPRATDVLPVVSVTRDGRSLLPEPGHSLTSAPPIQILATPNSRLDLLAWEPGHYEVKSASGQVRSFTVDAVPNPIQVSGPWAVEFQPGRGAPERATFDTLTDWSKNADSGIRYFSGTATYRRTFAASPEWAAGGRRVYLDLGEVHVMAQVKLNGVALGILWKPPFQVEVTKALRPGDNQLEIQVVNLWPNRMIGDEQLPDDSDRNPDGTLKKWPDWLQQDQPSPAGRVTFTTWRLWKKDSPLQPSGLLGPVTLRTAIETIK